MPTVSGYTPFVVTPTTSPAGENITFTWNKATVSSGTVTAYIIVINENTDDAYYATASARSLTVAAESRFIGTTPTFRLYIQSAYNGTWSLTRTNSAVTCTITQPIPPQHITGAASITGLTRSEGLFGSADKYCVNPLKAGAANLTWSAATGGNEKVAITYIVQKSLTGSEPWTDMAPVTSLNMSIPDTALPASGQIAYFRVKAYSYAAENDTTSSYFYSTAISTYGVTLTPTAPPIFAKNTFIAKNIVSCNIPTINIASNLANLEMRFVTRYKLKTDTVWTVFASTPIVVNTSMRNFEHNAPVDFYNKSMKYQVTCVLYFNNVITDILVTGETLNYSVYGEEPNPLSSIQFSVVPSNYYGTPPVTTYSVNLRDNPIPGVWSSDDGRDSFKYGANNPINLKINFRNPISTVNYNRAVEITWARGTSYTGSITCILNESLNINYINLHLVPSYEANSPIVTFNDATAGAFITWNCGDLFSSALTGPVTFTITAKNQLVSDTEVFLVANTPDLSDITSQGHFAFATLPIMYVTASIPSLNRTDALNVNFITREEPEASTDFTVSNIQARSLQDAALYGYKLKASTVINGETVEKIVDESVFSQSATETPGFDSTNKIFIPTGFALPGDQNIVTLALNILGSPTPGDLNYGGPKHLRVLLKPLIDAISLNADTLAVLDTYKTITYTISVVDCLKQESTETYSFVASYDFRIASKMLVSPVINFGVDGYIPLIKNITYYGTSSVENALCLHAKTTTPTAGETRTNEDYLRFEWYPAFKATDYALNPDNYVTIGNDHYLKYGCTDPNDYYIFRWNYGNTDLIVTSYKKLKLAYMQDYYAVADGDRLKYVGKFSPNLKKIDEDELFYYSIIPSYTPPNEEEKISHLTFSRANAYKENLCYGANTIAVPIYLARFTNPTTSILEINRVNDPKQISYKISDYGSSKKLNSIIVNNSNVNKYGPLSGIKVEARIIDKLGSSVIFSSNGDKIIQGQYTGDLSTNSDPTNKVLTEIPAGTGSMLDSFQYLGNFALDIYGTNLSDKDGYTLEIITTTKCKRCKLSPDSTSTNYIIIEGYDQVQTTLTYYIAPVFSTLSLRRSKVGINKSDLTFIEEALSIVGKDRCDAEGVNPITGSYKNIIGIYDSANSIMPNYDVNGAEVVNTQTGAYIGFHNVNADLSTWMGSIGFEEDGIAYIVSKDGTGYKKSKLREQTYKRDFLVADWTTNTITINPSVHKCGVTPMVDLYYKDNSLYKKAAGASSTVSWIVSISSTGIVTLTATTPFDGKVIIKECS